MKSLLGMAAAFLFVSAESAMAQVPSSCAQLLADYDNQDRQIAMINVEGIGDDSVPRETMRELRALNRQIQKLGLIEIMRGRSCPLPNNTNGAASYLSNALDCSAAMTRAGLYARTSRDSFPECDQAKWIKGGGYITASRPTTATPAKPAPQNTPAGQAVATASPAPAMQVGTLVGSKTDFGLVVLPLTPFTAKAVNYAGTSGGLVVMEVKEGSLAQKVGLLRGDIIISVNGYFWSSNGAMEKILIGSQPGDSLRVKFWRTGVEKDISFRY